MKIAVSTWSLHRWFNDDKLTALAFPQFCLDNFGIKAVEYVEGHLDSGDPEDDESLAELKKAVEAADSRIVCLALSNDFGLPNDEKRQSDVDRVKKWLKASASLSVPVVRINTGPIDLTGDARKRMVECVKQLIPLAQENRIYLALENHGRLTQRPRHIIKTIRSVDSEWFCTCPDFGNFHKRFMYEGVKKMAKYAVHAHAKSYNFDEQGEETRIDYTRMIDLLRKENYSRYLSVEYEGPGDQIDGTQKTIDLIKRHLDVVKV